MKHIFLAIETSGQACSAALITPQEQFVRFEPTQKAHTQLLLPMVQDLLTQAKLSLSDITAIAVGRGPGSFTGVRIAVSAAQGLAYGLNIPVYPVSTLLGLALQVQVENALIVPAIDARMNEIYMAAFVFNGKDYLPCVSERLVSPAEFLKVLKKHAQEREVIGIGSGWDEYFKEPSETNLPRLNTLKQHQVNALQIGLIAQSQQFNGFAGMSAMEVLPVYIRDDVAEKQK